MSNASQQDDDAGPTPSAVRPGGASGPQRPVTTFGRPPAAPDFPAPTGEPAKAVKPKRRRPPAGIIAIVALVVFAVIANAMIPLIAPAAERLWQQYRPGPGPGDPIDPGDRNEGGSGVGDPYFPDYGNSGYDARRYTVMLDWTPSTQRLSGHTVMSATADQRLTSFFVDLVLPVSSVQVNGEVADFDRSGFRDVKITPDTPIDDGESFEVMINYGGNPGDHQRNGQTPWWSLGGEHLVAGEPEAAAWWFPGNDHPSDRAAMDVTVRVPAGTEVISNGRLVSRDSRGEQDFDSWHWVARRPMASYLAFIAIGEYVIRQGTADGRPYVYAVSEQLSDRQRSEAFAQLRRTPEIIAALEQEFGPYPFGAIGGVVPVHDLWFGGLENQTRPIYRADAIADGEATDLLVHELAHMWFGDKITVAEWNDIFLNEAYASYAEWLRSERRGDRSAQDHLTDSYNDLAGNRRFWQTTMIDPGRDHLFDTVYIRGPMTLQALRNVIGDDAFFRFTRDWARRSGPHSLEEWMRVAQTYTSNDLDPFFDAWIRAPEAPNRTRANGLA